MDEHETQYILTGIEQAISREPTHIPEAVAGDKWLLASMMQKSVRRGETERAVRAAAALWNADRQTFWRRLHIIALEDVGVGAPAVVTKVLTATAASAWRQKIGDREVGLCLARMLSSTTKSRLCDAAFIQAEKARRFDDARKRLPDADVHTLSDYVADRNRHLVERALAAWVLAGTRRFRSDFLPEREGHVDNAIAAIRALDVPAPLTESCIGAMRLSPWPLSLFIPLIADEARKHPHETRDHAIPAAPDIAGLPLYALDMFTRLGRTCYQQLRKEAPALKSFSVAQIGLGMFYGEGDMVDKALTAPALDEIQRAGEQADIGSAGLSPAEYTELRQGLNDNLHLLEEIRRNRLREYLEKAA